MQTLRGKGKLYDSLGGYRGEITYELFQNGTGGDDWWGEITPREAILPAGDGIVELENGLRAPCSIRMRTNSSFGLVIDSFDVRGKGPFH